jgi:hypothetical protein
VTGAMERARRVDRATYTVEAVAILLMVLGEASHDKGNIHLALNWLGGQLEDAGMVLSDGGKS